MSTVSLMPIRKKFAIKKETKINVTSVLSTASNLEEAGILLTKGRQDSLMLLEEGALVRVDGFGGDLKDDPTVKLSVFPKEGRMGQVYVKLEDMDGLVWETYHEEPKKEVIPVKRYEVSLSYPGFKDRGGVWHNAFGGYKRWVEIEREIVNPLALSKEELEKGSFYAETTYDAGTAVFKYGKKTAVYDLKWAYGYNFKLEKPENGLMYAKSSYNTVELRIKPKYSSSEWEVVVRETRQSEESYEKMVKDFLKEKHKND
jgi:hypothetical protein